MRFFRVEAYFTFGSIVDFAGQFMVIAPDEQTAQWKVSQEMARQADTGEKWRFHIEELVELKIHREPIQN